MERHKESATPKDTYTHIFGSGFETWDWWLELAYVTEGWNGDYDNVPDNWTVRVTAEDGDDGQAVKDVSHSAIIEACWKIIESDRHVGVSGSVVRNIGALLFNADSADFDASSADELIQFIVLGEVVFA